MNQNETKNVSENMQATTNVANNQTNQVTKNKSNQLNSNVAVHGSGTSNLIITSAYGHRPATGVTPPQFHKGIDFGNPIGTEIKAAMDGEVVIAQRDGTPVDGYGICTVIKHGNGQWTLYAHQSEQFVKVGDTVKKGQVIGKLGSTGQSTGPHLHFGTTCFWISV